MGWQTTMKPEGKIIEVDFRQKKVLFKFGYETHIQKTLQLEQKLCSCLDDLYELTDDPDIRYKAKLLFEQLVNKLLDGN
jgi:hypothetical protein